MTSPGTVARRHALRQIRRRMDQQELNRREEIAVGNTNWEKLEGTVRLAFQNINGFEFDKEQVKYQRIFNFLKNYKIDNSFEEGADDHRPLILDVCERSFFGNSIVPSSKLRPRNLKMNDPRLTKNISNSYTHFMK